MRSSPIVFVHQIIIDAEQSHCIRSSNHYRCGAVPFVIVFIHQIIIDAEQSHFEVLFRAVRKSVKEKTKQASNTEDLERSQEDLSRSSSVETQVPMSKTSCIFCV